MRRPVVPQTREAARANLPGRPARRVQPADVPTRFHGNGENTQKASADRGELAFIGLLTLVMIAPPLRDVAVVLAAAS